ncbi:hypothetical protein Tco_0153172 [Tanacetum coccineum]
MIDSLMYGTATRRLITWNAKRANHSSNFYIQKKNNCCCYKLLSWAKALISLTDDLSLRSNMAALESCPKHNMIGYLEKTEGNVEFHEFWTSAKSKTINNARHITAKVAGKLVSISEASIRTDLLFDDADGIDTLKSSYL